jgi:S-DNA-T family DNA segregation ATPase FtsK/SpoIIIE
MTRHYRKRNSIKFRLKRQTVFAIFAILLIGSAFLTGLSFFPSGTSLDSLNFFIMEKFGLGSLMLPAVLISFSFLFLKIKASFAKPNVPFGLLLSFICILALTHSGFVGNQIWVNFESLVSPIGAFVILLGMLGIGLIVLFNTTLDEIIQMSEKVFKLIKNIISRISKIKVFKKQDKEIYIEKLPIKPPTEYKKDEKAIPEQKTIDKTLKTKTASSQLGILSSTIVSNQPSQTAPWEYPPLSLLNSSGGQKADRGDMKHNAQTIERTLESFGISAHVVEYHLGPAVTQYCLEIAMGTKLSKILALSNDLALALAAPGGLIRIEAPIPGRSLVGIEIPNRSLEFVTLKHMLGSEAMKSSKNKLTVALGLDVSGTPITANIAKMPHVLIAGTTGSGKSVLINTWISSLLFRTSPSEVRVIMIDPKRVELTGYNGIPHLLTPVIVEPEKILSALKWTMTEMHRRFEQFQEAGVRNIDGYNEMAGFQVLPYIVIFIDELAELMAFAPVEVEDTICRIAQMARATGIHLVIATQRPSVDVITGLIKANVPTRIAFSVSSMIDSRVIIDVPGAEKLLGRGDMLYIPPDQAKPTRIQGTYVSDHEVRNLVEYLKNKNLPVQYTEEVTSLPVTILKKSGNGMGATSQSELDGKDTQFIDAIRVVCQYDRASASLLQRKLSIGYARAARILDQLEEAGIVGQGEGSKPREVLIHNAEEYLTNQNLDAANNSNQQI